MSSNATETALGLIDNVRSQISIATIVSALLAVFVGSKVLKHPQNLKAVSHIPGFRVPFHPLRLPGVLLPTTWWNPGFYFMWTWRNNLYKRFGSDTISFVSFFSGPPTIYTANLDVTRQVASSSGGRSFIKPETASRAILVWGMNLLAADGDTWRKHRRIMGPAFNTKLFEMVWRETLTTYREMVTEEGWTNKKEVDIPVIQALTFKLALLIIGKCGFGFSFTWSEPARTADGRMSVQEAIRVVADTFMISSFVPKWIQNLPFKKLQECVEAQNELTGFMKAQVQERKAELSSGSDVPRTDAFSLLVKANEDEGGKFKLDDEELIGNVYIMLLAGHETTAHSIAATIGFLSLSDDIQEDIYRQIHSVVGLDRDPEYEDYAKLDKVLAAFYEGLRLFPAGYILIREAFEDTVLQIPNPVGEEGSKSIPIPKGTTVSILHLLKIRSTYITVQVVVDMIGVQYNPRYFDNPEEYRPSRWHGVSADSEAFSAFSIGPRTCIGRKFATTEVVCFLTMLLRDYKVQPIMRPGETKEEWRKRVMDGKLVLTLGVKDVPVKFVRRGRV
ncbi:cytochrome P450 [Pholiota conissans]|uniref:Cytochrome P450 n=1 Tax=Pholiota conissans TaxID=109636 RepID=A0A9P5ZA98_9AGAR|nr:cytochrome P450 [Pholiota conissans]